MNLTPETEQMLQWFIILSGILLIPVGVGLAVVIFKLAFLLHSFSEFLIIARYEITPLIKEVRLTVDHVEEISHRASSGMKDIGDGLRQVKPMVQTGTERLRIGAQALLSGIRRSFGA